MNSNQQMDETENYNRYCEIGQHRVYETMRCLTCLRFFCNKHVSHNCKSATFGGAIKHLFQAFGHRLVTRPMEKIAKRIQYGYLPKTPSKKSNDYNESKALEPAE